jgi:protease IV
MRLDRILALLLIVICFVAEIGNWMNGPVSRSDSSFTESPSVGLANVALIPVRGVIASTSDSPVGNSTSSSDDIVRAIRRARKDNVKAILMPINSPGGSAAASQEIYTELMRTRKETAIQIVASMGDVAASGGYYVASAAHHIVANPSTLTGSIGVIIQSTQVSGLLNTIGVRPVTFKSGTYKDILSPFRDPTEGERDLVEGMIQDTYQQFLDAIVTGRRNLPLTTLKPLADGRIFTGAQALKAGLIDSLGNYSDALKKSAELAKIQGEPTVKNYLTPRFPDLLSGFISRSAETLIPGYRDAKLALWNKVPLTLME